MHFCVLEIIRNFGPEDAEMIAKLLKGFDDDSFVPPSDRDKYFDQANSELESLSDALLGELTVKYGSPEIAFKVYAAFCWVEKIGTPEALAEFVRDEFRSKSEAQSGAGSAQFLKLVQ